jgi:hypothetical protein
VVIVDVFARIFVIAILAVGFVGIVGIVGIVVVNEASAVRAGDVVVFVTVAAQGQTAVSVGFAAPDAVETAVAESGEFVEAFFAHNAVLENTSLFRGKFCSAMEAYVGGKHGFLSSCDVVLFYTTGRIYR